MEKKRIFFRGVGLVWIVLSLLSVTCLQNTPAEAKSKITLRDRIKIKKRSYLKRGSTEEDENFSLAKMKILEKQRRNLIFDIQKFLREAADAEQKMELNLRLASLYMEDYYAQLAKAQRVYEKRYELFKKKKLRRSPKLDNSEAMAAMERARRIYADTQKRYPKHPRQANLLYVLAAIALDKGNMKEGMAYFHQLSKRFPNSHHTNEALVELGDYYFDKHQFGKAESYYNKIIVKKAPALLSYAKYKKGWTAYNQGRIRESLNNFKWVVINEDKVIKRVKAPSLKRGSSLANQLEAEATRNVIRVKSEALKDATLPYSDLKLVNESIGFYKKYGGSYYRKALENMGALYFEGGDYVNSIKMRQVLIKLDRNHKKNPEYDLAIIDSFRLKGDNSNAIRHLFAKLPSYLKNSSWHELNANQPRVIKRAKQLFEESARKYSFQLHAEAQKTKNPKLYEISKELYANYLKYFPNTTDSAKLRFYMAEIYYKQQQYVPASRHYYLVYKNPHAGPLRLDSIRYSLLALDRQLNIDRKKAGLSEISSRSEKRLKKGQKIQFVAYSSVEAKFISIARQYLKRYPKTKNAPDILYEQAYLQYDHHDLLKSYKGFWRFIKKYPKHEAAYSAAYLVLDILNRKKSYPVLIAACKYFLQNNQFPAKKFVTEVGTVLRHSELKIIALVEKKKQYKKAARAYLEYIKGYGVQDMALYEKALYNAAVNYSKAGLYINAVETQEKFLRRFPRSPLRENIILAVAKSYEKLTKFSKSAYYYELYARSYSQKPLAKSCLRLAGIYYWGSGNTPKAEAVMHGYLSRYPSGADRNLVKTDLIDLYETEKAYGKLISFYLKEREKVAITDFVTFSVQVAELKAKLEQPLDGFVRQVLGVALKHSAELQRSLRGKEALAKLLFWAVQQKEAQFYAIQLVLPEATLQRNLQTKMAMLNQLERDYKKISAMGIADWGLGSIYKLAAAYRHIAQIVLQAPVPNKLSAQQLEIYRDELKKSIIVPFNEKALRIAQQCIDKVEELNILSSWASSCYALAGVLQPKRYPIVRTFYLPPVNTALMLPKKQKSKIKLGDMKRYQLPYYSSTIFETGQKTRQVASLSFAYPWLRQGSETAGLQENYSPNITSYYLLGDKRKATLKKHLYGERPSKRKEKPSFAYLNLLRLMAPKKATPLIQNAIEREPENIALHNLLALTQFEIGDYSAAKVIWLSLIARGYKEAGFYNNLGAIASLQGKGDRSIDYFLKASKMGRSPEAWTNLGFIALKYHNGFEAKKHFQRALKLQKSNVTAQIGYSVAKLQNRELDSVKKSLPGLSKQHSKNPYARLSWAYLLMDIEKEPRMASRVLENYIDAIDAEKDLQFRRALSEAKQRSIGDGLPTID